MGIRSVQWVGALFAVLVAFAASGQEAPKKDEAVAAELKQLKGQWQITAAEQGGAATEAIGLVEFDGDKCILTDPKTKVVLENTIAIDPSKNPKWMDVTNLKTKQTWLGIYEFKGDTLRAVFQTAKDGKRPTAFTTRAGGSEVMYTYKRVKAK
jgi:uncharacterized protein (TIGR03067 family)